MSNKKSLISLAAISIIVLFFGFVGCSEETNTSNNSPVVDFESADYAILDFDDAMESLGEATLETDMSFGDFPAGNGIGNGFGNRNDSHPPFRGRHLHRIFRELDLSADQIESVRGLMDGHKECMRAAFVDFREANSEIIQAANEERRAIRQQVRDETITREEGRELIQQLNERTREAIHSNPASIAAHEEMCNCKFLLFDDIKLILTADQLILWDEWIAGLEGHCFVD